MTNIGKVYLVGAGCGDFDLITIRGKKLLEHCDTVIYDSLIDSRLLSFAPENAEKICVGKRGGKKSETQENINKLLVKKASEGKIVVRLKGGDPFVFGRGGEEILTLQKYKIPYSICPGITSCVAVPELAGIPVTHRKISRSFHVVTGHTAEDLLPENLDSIASLDGTLVFLMGLRNLSKITERLISCGKPENLPCAVISDGAKRDQKIVRGTISNIAELSEKADIKSPAVIIAGETAGYDFSPTIRLPLEGVSVAVTGTKSFSEKLSDTLSQFGAQVIKTNALAVNEYRNNPRFDKALSDILDYKWIAFTSANGVRIFLKRLKNAHIDIRKLCEMKFAAIGSGTAEELEKSGIFADLLPEIFTVQALGERLAETVENHEKVLILRAEKGSPVLTEILDKSGISYDDIRIYDVEPTQSGNSDGEVSADFIAFASSSGVKAFFENGGRISSKTKIVCIGRITADTLKEYGISDCLISEVSSAQGIADVIMEAEK